MTKPDQKKEEKTVPENKEPKSELKEKTEDIKKKKTLKISLK